MLSLPFLALEQSPRVVQNVFGSNSPTSSCIRAGAYCWTRALHSDCKASGKYPQTWSRAVSISCCGKIFSNQKVII